MLGKQFLSLHIGLLADCTFEPCICLIQNDNVLTMKDEVFLEIRKHFHQIENFFKDPKNSTNPVIRIDNIAIQPVCNIAALLEKFVLFKGFGQTNEECATIKLDRATWLQLVRLRDVLCLKLTFLRKYRLYAKIIFDRFVNHLATLDSSDITVLQLPTDQIYEHKYLKLNIEQFDVHVCQLLDAEIRAFLPDVISSCANHLRDTKLISFTLFHPFI